MMQEEQVAADEEEKMGQVQVLRWRWLHFGTFGWDYLGARQAFLLQASTVSIETLTLEYQMLNTD